MISRAAFALIVKFTESTMSFDVLNGNIKSASEAITDDSGVAKLKKIINKVKDENGAEFDAMLKRWETANQMRKWTQKIKLDISE